MNDWNNIYGPVPESFQNRVQATLSDLKGAQPEKHRHTIVKKTSRTMLVAAVIASLLTVTALAAGMERLGFFDTLFGTGAVVTEQAEVTPTPAPPEPEVAADGTVIQKAYEYTWADGTKLFTSVMPGYERTPVDEALAEKLISPYVQELNKSFVLDNTPPNGYADSVNSWGSATITFLSYVQDEAGTGYLYFSVENPDGLDLQTQENRGYTLAGDETVSFNGGSVFVTQGGRYFLLDTENTTDTKAYIGLPIVNAENCTLEIVDTFGFVGGFDETYELEAERSVPAFTAEGQYVTVSVSPMGASIAEAGDWAELSLIDYIDSFTVTMADGSEYVVFKGGDSPVDNTTDYAGRMDGSVGCCFNRIIDTEQIASVTVTVITGGNSRDGYTFADDTIVF